MVLGGFRSFHVLVTAMELSGTTARNQGQISLVNFHFHFAVLTKLAESRKQRSAEETAFMQNAFCLHADTTIISYN